MWSIDLKALEEGREEHPLTDATHISVSEIVIGKLMKMNWCSLYDASDFINIILILILSI